MFGFCGWLKGVEAKAFALPAPPPPGRPRPDAPYGLCGKAEPGWSEVAMLACRPRRWWAGNTSSDG